MKIVCFGDSVTRGISYVQGRLRIVKDNYPTLLQKALGSLCDVTNKGVFNDNSNLLTERLDKDVLSVHPDYVLIEIGGNDCNFHWDEVAVRPTDAHESIVPLQKYLDNVRSLILNIQRSGAVPILMNLLPLDPVRYYRQLISQYGSSISHWIALCGGIEHWHAQYNRALTELVATMNVMSIDVRNAFKRTADLSVLLSDDGVHPTAEGYAVMSTIVHQRLLTEQLV